MVETILEGQSQVQQESQPGESENAHHWKIDSPHGPTLWGVCINCKAQKEFSNDLPGYDFRDLNKIGRDSSVEETYGINGRYGSRISHDDDPDEQYFD
jgi:hypothetical protein